MALISLCLIQVTRNYIATTGKDMGVIIDRHSGVTVANLDHPGIVKCVVNPHNSQLAVTVGEDGFVKQWRAQQKHFL